MSARGRPTTNAWMAAALRFGRRNFGLTAPNPCVAALIVSDGALVGRGVTAPGGRPHAEASRSPRRAKRRAARRST